jgi:uncharacterized protein YecE (DUF72 family)
MPAGFRFTAKFPGDVSHAGDLRAQLDSAIDFTRLMAPLAARVPLLAAVAGAVRASRMGELAYFLDEVGVPVAVEVRNDAFFARGDEERQLNRLLHERASNASAWTRERCSAAHRVSPCCMRSPKAQGAAAPAFSQHPQVLYWSP